MSTVCLLFALLAVHGRESKIGRCIDTDGDGDEDGRVGGSAQLMVPSDPCRTSGDCGDPTSKEE